MVAKGRSACGTIKKCSCGRVILRIQTTKSVDSRDSSTRSTAPKSLKPHARGLKALKGLGKKIDNKADETLMCLDCTRKSKKGLAEQKIDKLNRVRVACSLSKFTKKKETGPVKPPPSLIKLKSSYTTGPTSSLSDAAHFKADSTFSPASVVVKKPPSRFTFEGVVPSMSSSLDSLWGALTKEESEEEEPPRDENSILNDLAKTEISSMGMKKEKSVATDNFILARESIALSDNKNFNNDADENNNVIPQRPRGKSADSEVSIEFSEAEFLKACAKSNHEESNNQLVAIGGACQEIIAKVESASSSGGENEAEGIDDPEAMQAYFDCDSGESLFWVFDFNPPNENGEDQNLLEHLNTKQVWFDLNALLFGAA